MKNEVFRFPVNFLLGLIIVVFLLDFLPTNINVDNLSSCNGKFDRYEAELTTIVTADGQTLVYEDYCSGNMLHEYYCASESQMKREVISCGNCIDGVCLETKGIGITGLGTGQQGDGAGGSGGSGGVAQAPSSGESASASRSSGGDYIFFRPESINEPPNYEQPEIQEGLIVPSKVEAQQLREQQRQERQEAREERRMGREVRRQKVENIRRRVIKTQEEVREVTKFFVEEELKIPEDVKDPVLQSVVENYASGLVSDSTSISPDQIHVSSNRLKKIIIIETPGAKLVFPSDMRSFIFSVNPDKES